MATAQVVALHRCDICEAKNDVEWKCVDCDENMCENCKIVHSKSKATRGHYIVNIFNENITCGKNESEDGSSCSVHPKEFYQRFCKTCDCLVCLECIAEDHSAHDRVRIQQIIDIKRQEALKYVEEFRSGTLKHLTEALEKNNCEQHRYSSQIEDLIKDISKRADELKAEIDNIKQTLITTLGQKKTDATKPFQQQKEKLEQAINRLKITMENSEKKLKESKGVDIIKAADNCKEALSQSLGSKYEAVIPSYPNFLFGKSAKNDLQKIFGQLMDGSCVGKSEIVSSFKPAGKFRIIVFEQDDRIWLASRTGKKVGLVDAKGQVLKTIDINTDPDGLAVMPSGELIFTNYDTCSIQKVTTDGKVKMLINTKPLSPSGLFITDAAEILATLRSSEASKVVRYSTTGEVLQTLQNDRNGYPIFTQPWFICQNINGDICVTNCSKAEIVLLDNNGIVKLKYRGPDPEAVKLKESFNPKGVICDRLGNILIADWNNDSIHVISNSGKFLKLIHCGTEKPLSITKDDADRIWVTYCENGKIWKVACIKYLY